jgi:hypothetical protein
MMAVVGTYSRPTNMPPPTQPTMACSRCPDLSCCYGRCWVSNLCTSKVALPCTGWLVRVCGCGYGPVRPSRGSQGTGRDKRADQLPAPPAWLLAPAMLFRSTEGLQTAPGGWRHPLAVPMPVLAVCANDMCGGGRIIGRLPARASCSGRECLASRAAARVVCRVSAAYNISKISSNIILQKNSEPMVRTVTMLVLLFGLTLAAASLEDHMPTAMPVEMPKPYPHNRCAIDQQ